jgi:flavin reductase (DIM6/NTAB) family NADH-FMN oxidoreductase RutF
MKKMSLGPQALGYPCPVFVIGTYDQDGQPNVMTASWAGIVSTQPPLLSVSLRPATYTHGAIMDRQAFTVSVPSVSQMKTVDLIGMVSGRKMDKFKAADLTPVKSEHVDAPYPDEMAVVLECRLVHAQHAGSHTIFIAEIANVLADPHVVEPSKQGVLPQMERLKPLVFSPGNFHYYAVGERRGRAFSAGKPSWLQRFRQQKRRGK